MNILGTFAELAQGLGVTLALFALTLVCSIPLGFLGSHVSLGKNKPAKFIYNIYLVVMRGASILDGLNRRYFLSC